MPANADSVALICCKCCAILRHSKYPDLVPGHYLFDSKGLAGCPEGGFHEVSPNGSSRTDDRRP